MIAPSGIKRDNPYSVQVLVKTAVEELIKGQTSEALKKKGAVSIIPRDTKVLSVAIVGEVATVDFSREVLKANVGSEAEVLGIYQIVNTLTELPAIKTRSDSGIATKPAVKSAIKRVRFTVEGKNSGMIDGRSIEDWWGHVGLGEQPFERDTALIKDGMINTDTISIETPRAFTTIGNPAAVAGLFCSTISALKTGARLLWARCPCSLMNKRIVSHRVNISCAII